MWIKWWCFENINWLIICKIEPNKIKISMWPVIQFSVKPNCLAIMQIIWHFKIHFWKIACGHGNHIKFENYFQSQNLSFTLNYFIWRFIWISSPCYWLIDWNKLIINSNCKHNTVYVCWNFANVLTIHNFAGTSKNVLTIRPRFKQLQTACSSK